MSMHINLDKLENKGNGWSRVSGSGEILEPKRWWHKLGVQRKTLTYTMSMFVKHVDDGATVHGTQIEETK